MERVKIWKIVPRSFVNGSLLLHLIQNYWCVSAHTLVTLWSMFRFHGKKQQYRSSIFSFSDSNRFVSIDIEYNIFLNENLLRKNQNVSDTKVAQYNVFFLKMNVWPNMITPFRGKMLWFSMWSNVSGFRFWLYTGFHVWVRSVKVQVLK